jgi:UV DNA damage endonuclease
MVIVRLGYACISLKLREKGIFSSRTLILSTLADKGVDEAKRLALLNIEDLIKIIEYNEKRGIRFFRITSNLLPHFTNPKSDSYTLDFARPLLAKAGKIARDYSHRITMHPAQFAQLGSPKQEVVDQTIIDLNMHADVMLAMGMSTKTNTVLIIHGGGVYGDKESALKRWESNFKKLPAFTQSLISLENDEWSYSVMDLLPLCERNSIPLCIDFFHHGIGHADVFDIFDKKLIERVMNTWKLRGIKPKIHWSNQKPNARKGTHGDCVSDIPKDILTICKKYSCDIMLEVKDKDECLMKMYKKHFYKIKQNSRVEWYMK